MIPRPRRPRGQSLVEFTLFFATLLIIFSGLVEFGFWMLEYSNLVVSARNAARYAADDDYQFTDPACSPSPPSPACFVGSPSPCDADFYCKAANVARETLVKNQPSIQLDPATDDVVVSVFTFTAGNSNVVSHRHPAPSGYWSLYGNHASDFSNADIKNKLGAEGVAHTSSGYVLIEIFYHYKHKLGLPWIVAFVPNPLLLHVYTFMPLATAAPTPTP